MIPQQHLANVLFKMVILCVFMCWFRSTSNVFLDKNSIPDNISGWDATIKDRMGFWDIIPTEEVNRGDKSCLLYNKMYGESVSSQIYPLEAQVDRSGLFKSIKYFFKFIQDTLDGDDIFADGKEATWNLIINIGDDYIYSGNNIKGASRYSATK